MSDNLLLLTPADPFAAPAIPDLAPRLAAAGFIAAPLQDNGSYKPGADFFRFVTFLGCSPVVALGEPGATAEICRVELPPVEATPVFLSGVNVKPPRCPGCGYRSPEGAAIGEAWQRDPRHHLWSCPACGRQYTAPQLNWRHCAGFGRCFVRIRGVFEGEAVPNDALLQLLTAVSGESDWRHFYLQL